MTEPTITTDQITSIITSVFGDAAGFRQAMRMVKLIVNEKKALARKELAEANRDVVIGNQNTAVTNRQTQLDSATTALETYVANLVDPE